MNILSTHLVTGYFRLYTKPHLTYLFRIFLNIFIIYIAL